jgi:hypothetical protein
MSNRKTAPEPKPEDYFSHNEHGYWCDNCGCLVKRTMLSDDHEEIPEFCPDCGFPEVTQEWIEANA